MAARGCCRAAGNWFRVCLKISHGFSRLGPAVLFVVFALASFALLTLALKQLDVGPAYAAWTGIGAAGTVLVGMIWLSEAVSVLKLVSIALVLAGIVGLQLTGNAH